MDMTASGFWWWPVEGRWSAVWSWTPTAALCQVIIVCRLLAHLLTAVRSRLRPCWESRGLMSRLACRTLRTCSSRRWLRCATPQRAMRCCCWRDTPICLPLGCRGTRSPESSCRCCAAPRTKVCASAHTWFSLHCNSLQGMRGYGSAVLTHAGTCFHDFSMDLLWKLRLQDCPVVDGMGLGQHFKLAMRDL